MVPCPDCSAYTIASIRANRSFSSSAITMIIIWSDGNMMCVSTSVCTIGIPCSDPNFTGPSAGCASTRAADSRALASNWPRMIVSSQPVVSPASSDSAAVSPSIRTFPTRSRNGNRFSIAFRSAFHPAEASTPGWMAAPWKNP